MNASVAGATTKTIKPDDLVRLPSGHTAICTAINADGSREVQDLITGEFMDMRLCNLYLVRSAKPKPWPNRTP